MQGDVALTKEDQPGKNQYNLATGRWVNYEAGKTMPYDCGTATRPAIRRTSARTGSPASSAPGPSLGSRARSARQGTGLRLSQRIIFVTGGSLSPGIREFLEQTKVPSLGKPFTPDSIRLAIQRVL